MQLLNTFNYFNISAKRMKTEEQSKQPGRRKGEKLELNCLMI